MFLRLVNVSEIRKNVKIRVTKTAKIQHYAVFFPNFARCIWEFNQSTPYNQRL